MKDRKDIGPAPLDVYANYSNGIYSCKELPPLIDVPYPCFAIADLPEIINKLAPAAPEDKAVALQEEFLQIQRKYIDPGFTFISIDSRSLVAQVTQRTLGIAAQDPSNGIVNMDRSICSECRGDQFFQLNISRGEREGLVARPGIMETPERQTSNLITWASANNFSRLTFVDDVLAYGDTLVPLVKHIQEALPSVPMDVLVAE